MSKMNWKCPICMKEFEFMNELDEHIAESHSKDELIYVILLSALVELLKEESP